MKPDDRSRLRLLMIDWPMLLCLLQGTHRLVGLPEDAEITMLRDVYERNGVALHIWSATYEPAKPHEHLLLVEHDVELVSKDIDEMDYQEARDIVDRRQADGHTR